MASSGVLSPDIASTLLTLQRGKCANCKQKLTRYHLDHVMPLALGGANEDQNMQLLCPGCNCRKQAMHPISFAQKEGRLL
jgi:5-methylcytosine-specific restriction endonuclease McrA